MSAADQPLPRSPEQDPIPLEQNSAMEASSSEKPVVVITGSGGLIGGALVPKLRQKYRVIGMDLSPPEPGDSEVDQWIGTDLTSDENVVEAFGQLKQNFGDRLASVIHLAAYYDFSGADSPLYKELTVEGTRRVLDQLQNFQVEQFMFSSSLVVMESAKLGDKLTSDSPTNADWAYPKSKLETEKVIYQRHGDIPALILRIAGVYDEDGHSPPICNQIKRIYEKQMESYFFPGDEDCGQSFVHREDVAECLFLAVEKRHELPAWKTLLIGEEDVMSYEELQDAIGQYLHGKEWPTIRIPAPVAKAGAWVMDKMASDDDANFIKPWMIDMADQNFPIDGTEAREALGWTAKRTLRGTLAAMCESLRRDPDRFYKINKLGTPERSQSKA